MRGTTWSLALAIVLLMAVPSNGRSQSMRSIIVVFTIEDRGANLGPKILDRLSSYLAIRLAATGKYQVVPRDMLKKRLSAAKRQSYKKCYDQSCQIEIGRELAAQMSLATTIIKLGSTCSVTAVLYDLRKSASAGGATAEGSCAQEGIVASIKSIVAKLAGKEGSTAARPPPKSEARPRPGLNRDQAGRTTPSSPQTTRPEVVKDFHARLMRTDPSYHSARTLKISGAWLTGVGCVVGLVLGFIGVALNGEPGEQETSPILMATGFGTASLSLTVGIPLMVVGSTRQNKIVDRHKSAGRRAWLRSIPMVGFTYTGSAGAVSAAWRY